MISSTNIALPSSTDPTEVLKSTTRSHKRQMSIGLGIITHLTEPNNVATRDNNLSKNDTFFDTSTSMSNQMRPPPALSILTKFKTQYHHYQQQQQQQNGSQTSITEDRPTFADRIRNIVLANRKTAAIMPRIIVERSCSNHKRNNTPRANDNSNYNHDNLSFPEEKIVPLPSPAQPSLTRASTFTRHLVVTPILAHQDTGTAMNTEKDEKEEEEQSYTPPPGSAIPIISFSPSFSPNKTNIIPPLQEVPMLGDMEDNGNNMIREFKFPSPEATTYDDTDSLMGKHIWKFRIKQLLGVGAFSKVFLAQNMEEGGLVAVKMINKERMYQDLRVKSSIEREVGVLKFLNHDRIVQLEATMETQQHLCIVLEYVKGGELFDFVQHMHNDIHQVGIQSSIDELLIKRLALELIQVVSWLHQRNIVHRDLKLENILVYFDEETGGEPHIKVTDFGLARIVNPEAPTLTTRCGSEEYAAPEIVQSLGYDGRLTDTWSIGIIIYALLVGYLPFSYDISKGEKISHLFHRIVMAQVKWPLNDNISFEAKDVVEQILVRNPERRTRLNQVTLLPWFIQ